MAEGEWRQHVCNPTGTPNNNSAGARISNFFVDRTGGWGAGLIIKKKNVKVLRLLDTEIGRISLISVKIIGAFSKKFCKT